MNVKRKCKVLLFELVEDLIVPQLIAAKHISSPETHKAKMKTCGFVWSSCADVSFVLHNNIFPKSVHCLHVGQTNTLNRTEHFLLR